MEIKRPLHLMLLAPILLAAHSCSTYKAPPAKSIFAKDNLLAWCLVPYDAKQRNAEERARTLNELGLTKYAYDWRVQHLPAFGDEIKAMQRHNIKLEAVWFWVDGNNGELLDGNHWHILETLRRHEARTTLWVSFNPRFFDNLSDSASLAKGVKAVGELRRVAAESRCKIALYNHGDWFGNPLNQIRIIAALGAKDVGLVYNFHHAHDQVAQFPLLLKAMLPYLEVVNLNGMRAAGPKILTLGEGESELEMMQALRDSGFRGAIGVLGHVEKEDVRVVLERNLAGLQTLLKRMGEEEALRTYARAQ